MQSLLQFGLQKSGAKEGDNVCPQTVDTSGSESTLKLDLDKQCSLVGLKKDFPDYYSTLMQQFNKLCVNAESCDMYVRDIDWPEPCREKIGYRL